VLALALAARAAWSISHPAEPLWGDSEFYDRAAWGIATGTWWPDSHPIGYPLFLAAIYAVTGHSVGTVIAIQCVIGAASCVLIALVTEDIFDSRLIGLLSGLATALWLPWIRYCALVLTETPFIFFVVVSVFVMTRALKKDRLKLCAVAGVCLGAASLVRAISMLMPVAWIPAEAWILRSVRRTVVALLWTFVPMVIVLAPYTVSNYRISGDFFPATQGGGLALWRGATFKQTLADPDGMPWEPEHFAVTRGHSMWTPEGDARLKAAARETIWADPMAYADKLINRWALFWLYAPGGWLTGRLGKWRDVARYSYWVVLLGLALVGTLSSLRRGYVLVAGTSVLYLSAVQAMVNFNSRYRLPVEGYVLALAVGGAAWVLAQTRPGHLSAEANKETCQKEGEETRTCRCR